MLLTTVDVARAFGTNVKTITRWESDGDLPAAGRTVGGHRRWDAESIAAVLLLKGYKVPAAWGLAVAA